MPLIQLTLRVRRDENGGHEVSFARGGRAGLPAYDAEYFRKGTNLDSGRMMLLAARIFRVSYQGGPRAAFGLPIDESPSPPEVSFVLDFSQIFALIPDMTRDDAGLRIEGIPGELVDSLVSGFPSYAPPKAAVLPSEESAPGSPGEIIHGEGFTNLGGNK